MFINNNANLRIDISNSSQNLDIINFKLTSFPSGNYREENISWSSLSDTYSTNGYSTTAYYDISTNSFLNSKMFHLI